MFMEIRIFRDTAPSYCAENGPTFRRNMSPSSSGQMNKPTEKKHEAYSKLCFRDQLCKLIMGFQFTDQNNAISAANLEAWKSTNTARPVILLTCCFHRPNHLHVRSISMWSAATRKRRQEHSRLLVLTTDFKSINQGCIFNYRPLPSLRDRVGV